jgi:hypothetical protein
LSVWLRPVLDDLSGGTGMIYLSGLAGVGISW